MYRILVIEDETPLREEIVDQLIFAGYRVFGAPDGQQGIDAALENEPDIIICDISMPVMDGYEVLQFLRGHEKTRITPFIFLTARTDRPFMRHGMELGADDYLTKPFARHELLAAIESRLRQAERTRSAYTGELEQLRSKLVYMVSHELKSPLIGVKMASEMLDRHFHALSLEEIKDLIASVRFGGERLHHLIQQFTIYFQFESGHVSTGDDAVVAASINHLVLSAVNNARQYAFRNSTLQIIASCLQDDMMMHCNPPLLKHAFIELIVNALNFSRPDGTVWVNMNQYDTRLIVTIIDEGIGIEDDDIEAAFQPFTQINREAHEQQGVGLGLTLVDRIMRLHNAALKFESTVGKGTRITIEFALGEE